MKLIQLFTVTRNYLIPEDSLKAVTALQNTAQVQFHICQKYKYLRQSDGEAVYTEDGEFAINFAHVISFEYLGECSVE